jgi:hypothetical protein
MGAAILSLLTGTWNLAGAVLKAVRRILARLNGQGWVGLLCTLLALLWGIHGASEARHWKKQDARDAALYAREHAAFGQTVLNYRVAAAKQKAEDDAKNARTVAAQQTANQETKNEYEARIAAARAQLERLRRAPAADPGRGAGTLVPSVPTPAGGTSEGPANGLSLDDRYTCTAQGIQLDELIKWTLKQHAIDPNAGSK